MVAPQEGTLVVHYSMLPDQQGRGDPDLSAFYMWCNPVSDARYRHAPRGEKARGQG
jgi:hypothetical protein